MQVLETGTPAVLVATDPFAPLAEIHARALGSPDALVLTIPHPLGGIDDSAVQAKASGAIDPLLRLITGPREPPAQENGRSRPADDRVRLPNDTIQVLNALRGWADGLPAVPPTAELVAEMVAAIGRPADEIVAVLPPAGGRASIELIAANAVLAGCSPLLGPLVVAAVEAVADPAFNLVGVQPTTHPCAALVIVSGPAAERAGIHGGEGCLGSGFGSNLALGRALRLILMNVGGARPGIADRSCQGTPAKIAFCFAENLASSPWKSFHVDEGFDAEDSAVTVVAAEGPHNIQDHSSRTAADLLDTVACAMRSVGGNDFAIQVAVAARSGLQPNLFRSRPVLVLGPEHAATIASEGYSRRDVQRALWESARVLPGEIPRGWTRKRDIDHRVPLVERPEDLIVVVAGGAGKHSCWMPTFGSTTAVTRRVELHDGSG